MKNIATIAAALALTLVISACGQGQGADAQDDELNIAWNAQPPTLDPMMATSNATRDLSRNVFEPLLTVDGTGLVKPVLAADFSINEARDEIQFELRDDVVFHDGDAMTEDDVIASIQRWIELSSSGQTYFADSEVSSPERGLVVMNFTEPVPMAPTLLADQNVALVVMPKDVIPEDPTGSTSDLIGTGPYELSEWNTDHYVKLNKFEDYASPAGPTDGAAGTKNPYFETIYYHFVQDSNTRAAGLQTGEYDVAFSLGYDTAEAIKDDDDIVQNATASSYQVAIFNKKKGPMADLKMRQAATSAINVEPVLRSAFSFPRFYTKNRALMSENSNIYTDEGVKGSLEYDPEKAKELLDEAGYDGEPVKLITSRDYDHLYNMTVVLQQQLESVGINTEMVVADFPTVSSRLDSPDAWDIFIDAPSWRVLPNSHTHLGAKNVGWPDDPRLIKALDSVIQSHSDEEASEAVGEVQSAYFDNAVGARLGDSSSVVGVRKGLDGYESSPTSGPIFYNMYPSS